MQGIFDFIKSLMIDLDIRGRWLATLGLIVFIVFSILTVERFTHFNYYYNLSRRVELLSQLNSLAEEGIDQRPELYSIYKETVNELSQIKVLRLSLSIPNLAAIPAVQFYKALSGASIWLVFLIIAISGGFGRTFSDRFKVSMGLTLVTLFFGFLGWIIPVIINPWVNYIGLPLIQISLFVYIARKT